jgi:hypothetical protein
MTTTFSGSARCNSTTTSSTCSSKDSLSNGVMVDFGAAVADPVAAVEQLLQYCSGNNTTATTNVIDNDGGSLHAAAVAIAAGASRESTRRVLAGATEHPTAAMEAAYHFPNGDMQHQHQQQEDEKEWTVAFSSLPVDLQRVFALHTVPSWDTARRSSVFGRSWGSAAVMEVP